MAKGKYSDRMGVSGHRKAWHMAFHPSIDLKITTYHHIEGLLIYDTYPKLQHMLNNTHNNDFAKVYKPTYLQCTTLTAMTIVA